MAKAIKSYTKDSKVITFRVEIGVYNIIQKMAMDRKTSITRIIEEMVLPVVNKKMAAIHKKELDI